MLDYQLYLIALKFHERFAIHFINNDSMTKEEWFKIQKEVNFVALLKKLQRKPIIRS